MNDSSRLGFITDCTNMVCDGGAGDVFTHLLKLVGDILSHHGDEAAELVRSSERAIQLILVDCVIVLIDISTVEVGLEDLRLALDLLIYCESVTVSGTLASVICGRVLIPIVIYKIAICNGQFANTVAIGDLIHHDTVKFPAIRPNGENGAGQHLGNSFHQRVIAGFQRGLCRSDKARAVYRRDGSSSGCLALNRVQNRRCLGKSKIVCH